jgi:hypothetical protein
MNRKQKICLWVGIAVIVTMGIFPPWMITGGSQGCLPMGYSFILNPPSPANLCRIDASRLCIQWVMVAVVTGGLIFTFGDKKPKKPKDKQKE